MADFRTSTYLREQLEELDQNGAESSENTEAISSDDRVLLGKLQAMVVESLEALSSEECERVHRVLSEMGDACEYMLDDYFARRLLRQVPEIVSRVIRFDPIVVPKIPAGPTNAYLREAVRCYVLGLNQGAVALARAAMEQAFLERVPYASQQRWLLDELIDMAGRLKVLGTAHLQMASDVQHLGNAVLHRKPCSSEDACQALTKARVVLEELFRSDR